jgi:carbon monoxide dehydrogenase subunit G
MTTFRTQIDAKGSQDEVFEYLATFSNARHWDPGVTEGEALNPGPAAVGSVYRIGVRIAGRVVPFDYRVVDIDRPRGVVLVAQRGHMVSTDTIAVQQVGAGSRVHYQAVFEGRGLLRVAAPLIGRVFTTMAERGAAGLRAELA